MNELIKALSVGVVTGFLFGMFKLPIPAPSALAGLLGVVGIYLGYLFAKSLR